MSTALILLAAGGSTRMGTPKQALRFRGRSLLCHAAETALASRCRPVIVVLGSAAETLRPELAGLDVEIVVNADWKEGMRSSLQRGLQACEMRVQSVLFMTCDQPFVTPELLNRLTQTWQEQQCWIVACAYGKTTGIPALFDKSLFSELHELQGAQGAKHLIERHDERAAFVSFPEGSLDVDTPEDYARLALLAQSDSETGE